MKMRAVQGALYLCVYLLLCESPGVHLKKLKRQNSSNGEAIEKPANYRSLNAAKKDETVETGKSKALKKQKSVSLSVNEEKHKDAISHSGNEEKHKDAPKLRGSKRQRKKEKKKTRKEETTGFYRSDKLKCKDKLNSRLVKYYEEEVHLPSKDMKSVQKKVDGFVKELWNHVEVNLEDLRFTKYSLVGSMSEGLSTKYISDFDYHLLLNIGDTQLTSHPIPNAAGYHFLACIKGQLCDQFGKIQDGKSLLYPQAFIRTLQSIVQKTLVSGKIPPIPGCSKYRLGTKGPTVSVEFECPLEGKPVTFRVELVPLLEMTNGKKFVAKSISRDVDTTFELSWRESFTDQERAHIKKKSSDDLTVLRLMKHIVKQKTKQFSSLTSYFLKNVYFHMDGKGYPWQTKRLCDQLMDYLDTLFTLAKNNSLPCYFDDKNNLFLSLSSSDTLRNMESRLQKVLENYESFVKEWIDFQEFKDEL